jgi:hypothetical protein
MRTAHVIFSSPATLSNLALAPCHNQHEGRAAGDYALQSPMASHRGSLFWDLSRTKARQIARLFLQKFEQG